MREWAVTGRARLSAVDWLRLSRRTAVAGFWLFRFCLGAALVLFALSFLGPAPVDRVEVGYASPDVVAHDAVANLRASTYRLTLEADRTDGAGDATPLVEETRTVDNGAHQYVVRSRTGPALANRSIRAGLVYGTYTTGYRRPQVGGSNAAGGESGDAWTRDDRHRYHPSRNAFGEGDDLEGARATVVSETAEASVVRVTDRATVADVVELPDHEPERTGRWNATLTLHVDRDADRLTRAEYRYRGPDGGERVRATYRFEYGTRVDVDRPLATYPPGDEAITRLDLGIRAVERALGGARS